MHISLQSWGMVKALTRCLAIRILLVAAQSSDFTNYKISHLIPTFLVKSFVRALCRLKPCGLSFCLPLCLFFSCSSKLVLRPGLLPILSRHMWPSQSFCANTKKLLQLHLVYFPRPRTFWVSALQLKHSFINSAHDTIQSESGVGISFHRGANTLDEFHHRAPIV